MWNDLSQGQRRLVVAAAVVEGVLKVAMLADLKRRPASAVRGPRWLWAASTLVSSAGLLPGAYFLVGRRQTRSR